MIKSSVTVWQRGGVRSEKSARYALRVRPVHRDASIAYDISAMGIKVPAHDAPAIDSSLFQQYEYLQPARDCVPLAKEKIDLLVGSQHFTRSPHLRTKRNYRVQPAHGWAGCSLVVRYNPQEPSPDLQFTTFSDSSKMTSRSCSTPT